ncbi:Hypothetical protein LUCI_2456 [Lucifera butyrica]|uniref:HTH cro/C1-type domain-containing protein n=1 Tax=Lucifera butyrica TaxID=1351585 RepID=A0A498RA96_9FIRM|nr:helix-turn-helix transcriptional regulator [Lucifera butyrica]VBB07212.1 Hypothetical protein LUCI_2456 [Lucifera butyrica]
MTKSKELGSFLQRKRLTLRPEQVGIHVDKRRRVKGLRREEVADLAGVSIDWYIRIEQGRENVNPSISVLNSLSKALQLNYEEKRYLFNLSDKMPPANDNSLVSVSETLQKFLDNQNPSIAYVMDQNFAIIAWNQTATKVYGYYENMGERERNTIWRAFNDSYIRKILDDWEGYSKLRVEQLRTNFNLYQNNTSMMEMINELKNNSLFNKWWNDQKISGTPEGQKLLHHPKAGDLYLCHITFEMTEMKGAYITIQMPADNNTKRKLQQLLL